VVNEKFAKRWWPTPQQAIGAQIKFGGPYAEGTTYQIVGVVSNVNQYGLDQTGIDEEIYLPFEQEPNNAMVVMIRTKGNASSLADTVRRHVTTLDNNIPIQSLRPFEQWMGASLDRRRFTAELLSGFALLALLLAMVGVYGVLNYWVSIRQKEIAVRVALGASQSTILRWVGQHALKLAVVAAVVGLAGAWASSRWMESMVFGISAKDPAMMVIAVLTMAAMVIAACLAPAWRAMHVDPGQRLRGEG
jgi:predicted lysophospholipase L1 biosynthesis ABC-type transport system permease subunit